VELNKNSPFCTDSSLLSKVMISLLVTINTNSCIFLPVRFIHSHSKQTWRSLRFYSKNFFSFIQHLVNIFWLHCKHGSLSFRFFCAQNTDHFTLMIKYGPPLFPGLQPQLFGSSVYLRYNLFLRLNNLLRTLFHRGKTKRKNWLCNIRTVLRMP
jgi:hypothetical protein